MFKRDQSLHDQTAAFLRFKQYHTEINNLYWSFIPTKDFAEKALASTPTETTVAAAFSIKEIEDRRFAPTLTAWRDNFKEFENWTRLNCLMAASSYFEIYFKTIINLSLLSRPGILFSAPDVIDGATFLKHKNAQLESFIKETINSITIGDWNTRSQHFSSIFGSGYQAIKENIAQLEKIRKIRNGIGHAFGRDLRLLSYTFDVISDIQRVSQTVLQKYLKLLMDISTSLDKYMLKNYIGAYETLYYFATRIYKETDLNLDTNVQRFKKHYHEEAKIPSPSKKYCEELVHYFFNL